MPARSYSYPNSTEIVLRRGSSSGGGLTKGSIAAGSSIYTSLSRRSSATEREAKIPKYSRSTTISIRTNDHHSRAAAPTSITATTSSSFRSSRRSHTSSRWDVPDHVDPHVEGLPTHEYFSSGLSRNLRLPEWRGQRREFINNEEQPDLVVDEDLGGFSALNLLEDEQRSVNLRSTATHATTPIAYSSVKHSISPASQARSRASQAQAQAQKPSLYRAATEHAKAYYPTSKTHSNSDDDDNDRVLISARGSEDSYAKYADYAANEGGRGFSYRYIDDDDGTTVVPDDSISCIMPRSRLNSSSGSKGRRSSQVTRKSARGLEQGPFELASRGRVRTY